MRDAKRSISLSARRKKLVLSCISNVSPADRFQLIVATSNNQVPYLDHLQTLSCHPSLIDPTKPTSPYSNNSSIPAYFLGPDEARELEPDLTPDLVGALLVTETGILDSQALVESLAREVEEEDYQSDVSVSVGVGSSRNKGQERGEGVIVKGTRVVRIDRDEKGGGWVVQLETGWEGKEEGEKGEVEGVLVGVVVNAAGLGAASLTEAVVPEKERVGIWASKGETAIT